MRSTALFYLLTFTFLLGTTLLTPSEASGQGVRVQPQTTQVAPPTLNFPQPYPAPTSYHFKIDPLQPLQPQFTPIPLQVRATDAPRAVQSADAAFASGTPSPDTTEPAPDSGDEVPTPETTPTATPTQTFIPTPTPNEADDTSSAYSTPSPSPTATPSPQPNYSTSTRAIWTLT
jgi:hypothetical protein